MLLGVVTLAAGAHLTIGAGPHPEGQAVAVACGAALFLAGSAWFRRALRLGPTTFRLAGAAFALATIALGATVSVRAQLAVLLAGLIAMLAAQHYRPARHSPQPGTASTDPPPPARPSPAQGGTGRHREREEAPGPAADRRSLRLPGPCRRVSRCPPAPGVYDP
jgi:hypothetical protein